MIERKIMALGKSSLVVSLPRQWCKNNELERGDKVSMVIRQDNSLVIHPANTIREDAREIHLGIEANEEADSIIRRVIGTYLDGYTTVKMTSEKTFTSEQQVVIRQIVGILYMMIVESEASSIVLQTLIDESKLSLISGVERMHLITYSMLRDTIHSLETGDGDILRSVLPLEDDVDQLMYLLLRTIRSAALSPSLANKLDLDALDCLDYQTLVHRIERIADHITSIANSLISLIENDVKLPEEANKVLLEAAKIALTSYNQAVEGFFEKLVENTNTIIDKQREINELFKDITPFPIQDGYNDTFILTSFISLRENIKKIGHYTADIAELTIDRAYKFEI